MSALEAGAVTPMVATAHLASDSTRRRCARSHCARHPDIARSSRHVHRDALRFLHGCPTEAELLQTYEESDCLLNGCLLDLTTTRVAPCGGNNAAERWETTSDACDLSER